MYMQKGSCWQKWGGNANAMRSEHTKTRKARWALGIVRAGDRERAEHTAKRKHRTMLFLTPIHIKHIFFLKWKQDEITLYIFSIKTFRCALYGNEKKKTNLIECSSEGGKQHIRVHTLIEQLVACENVKYFVWRYVPARNSATKRQWKRNGATMRSIRWWRQYHDGGNMLLKWIVFYFLSKY